MRSISPSFVVAPPTGAKVRTRLRLSIADEAVLLQVGEHLGSLAGGDLAARSQLGRGPDAWTDRKRVLTWRAAAAGPARSPALPPTSGRGAIRTCWTSARACTGPSAACSAESRRPWVARVARYAGTRQRPSGGPSSVACTYSPPGRLGSRRGWRRVG